MSRASKRYNCIAWAAGNDTRWWWPDAMGVGYWPPNVPRADTFAQFVRLYSGFGYTLCFDGALERGFEKVALYGKGPKGSEIPTHAALQLENGEWTSKLGPFEDIKHTTPGDVEGPTYGRVVCFLRRPRP